MHDATRHVSKRRLLSYYMDVRREGSEHWQSWQVDAATHEAVVALLQAKPRRTASGVATITVLTRPRACSSDCVYCPSDARMPKSYMNNEPACQRAERNFFDPYLQVASRMRVLGDMGHVTDKVELIVLGGTWSDYPEAYQVWFISKMFEALNDDGAQADARRHALEAAGCICEADALAELVAPEQLAIDAGKMTYNQAREVLDKRLVNIYSDVSIEPLLNNPQNGEGITSHEQPTNLKRDLSGSRGREAHVPRAPYLPQNLDEAWLRLEELQAQNESCAHRNVGLVIETRPDLISQKTLYTLRRLGCTKVQIGIQSLDERILALNGRHVSVDQIARAFELLRLYGFKSHIHFMVNLLGATPAADKADFARLVQDSRFLPDEAKLYPCALVENSALMDKFRAGEWAPYSEQELIDVLVSDVLAAPPYLRISRMIRDISATDIVVGNKKTNLRQLVEQTIEQRCAQGVSAEADACADADADARADASDVVRVREMRMREIATADVNVGELHLDCVTYDTTVTREYFLQWVGKGDALAGFLRLSLPSQTAVAHEIEAAANTRERDAATRDGVAEGRQVTRLANAGTFPIKLDEAMIREVHVYGRVAAIHKAGDSAQHAGLGRKLVERACEIAREAGFKRINVISAIGTRDYYRNLGFKDNNLYLTAEL
jgi:elongator complex protein 3